ncbi:MAG TPA: molybdate ABC transporter permease subunit [Gemmatimonadaceae bacterium]|nr:molybdate ABC transporter permease subunit [Gemmatimonadaceae bacterium]
MTTADTRAIALTVALATTTTVLLLAIGAPLALWLSQTRSRARPVLEAIVALPLVLPPTVLGFYVLVALGPLGPIGGVWESLGGPRLVFSFPGLVIGSMVYSLPFVVQPMQAAFRAVPTSLVETATLLGAMPFDRFRTVILPLSRHGVLTAAVLGFAHTVGEFGVVLMIGGNIPGRTQVVSIALFNHVERLQYGDAHVLAGGLVAFAFIVLFAVYSFNRRFDAARP